MIGDDDDDVARAMPQHKKSKYRNQTEHKHKRRDTGFVATSSVKSKS